MPRYDAILFDFDGVLLDSEPVHFECWHEALKPHGVDLDWETYRDHCIGVSDYQMLEFLGSRAVPPVAAERLWEEYAAKNRKFVELMQGNPPVPADTQRLLSELGGYRLAVVSSSGRDAVEPILMAAGVRDHFDAVVCAGDVVNHKPSPEPYLLAARMLRVETALVVEDSDAGAKSGRDAGFDVVQIDDPERMAGLVRERLSEKD